MRDLDWKVSEEEYRMSLYEKIKDLAKVVQQADNVDLYVKLLDLGATALDMQEEITKLKEENRKLKEQQDIQDKVIRHKELYVTMKDDESILYCAHCWDDSRKLIQVKYNDCNGAFKCPHCKVEGIYDIELQKEAEVKEEEAFSQLSTRLSRIRGWDMY